MVAFQCLLIGKVHNLCILDMYTLDFFSLGVVAQILCALTWLVSWAGVVVLNSWHYSKHPLIQFDGYFVAPCSNFSFPLELLRCGKPWDSCASMHGCGAVVHIPALCLVSQVGILNEQFGSVLMGGNGSFKALGGKGERSWHRVCSLIKGFAFEAWNSLSDPYKGCDVGLLGSGLIPTADRVSVADRVKQHVVMPLPSFSPSTPMSMLSSISNRPLSQRRHLSVLRDFALHISFAWPKSFAFIGLQRVRVYFYTVSSCIFLTLLSVLSRYL